MQTIGLIGGMSWESSALYYRQVNTRVRERLGGLHSAKVLMASVDFAEIAARQHAGDWDGLAGRMVAAARRLQAGGADFLVLCTNTMHRLAGDIEAAVPLPLLHIADPTGAAAEAAGVGTVGLLGTAFTMEQAFYRRRLEERFGLAVLVPDEDDRALVHRVIYEELVRGRIEDASRAAYRAVMARLVARGAGAIILGCTEITLLVGAGDAAVPLLDTTALHAAAAADRALAGPSAGTPWP